ncbi:MAG TPA: hypothetical protein VMZ53_28645 [Kofleriaceae bacterium]|nr:hypothetical protein [Kofleriaceae bacterium]
MRLFGALLVFGVLAACKGAERPRVPAAGSSTIDVSRSGFSLRAVAGDGARTFVGLSTATQSVVEARRGTTVEWRADVPGVVAALALVGPNIIVGTQVSEGMRGDPGAALQATGASGKTTWRVAIDSTEWSLITSMAALDDDILVGGSFGGTLRIADKVVSSAGGSDGFVARISAKGELVWLVRLGGGGADAVQGVATSGSRIAIAGTFTAGADLLGEPLAAYDERLPYADAFAAELDDKGTRRWSKTFGGKGDESVAGVAIDARGNVVVAGNGREVIYVGSQRLVTGGDSDGVVVWYGATGEQGPAILVGGLDYDGLRAIAAVDDRVVVGGFFAGTLTLGDRTLVADGKSGGGDDAFFAALDPRGLVERSWHVGGEGREDIVALSHVSGGFIAAVAHTGSAKLDDATLPAPADPMSGAAIAVRGL